MSTFDLTRCPLESRHLIEAGAGTGKTYTITRLFLRLLLEKRLPVESILVVTFTEAATEELRHRLRDTIQEGLAQLKDDATQADPTIRQIVRGQPADQARRLLQAALHSFDEASVFTIHGFCQRVLKEHAFESGVRFDTELITDAASLVQEVIHDYWRVTFFAASPRLISYALDRGMSPQSLQRLVKPHLLQPDLRILPPLQEMPDTSDEERRFSELFESVAEQWDRNSEEIERILYESDALSRQKYSPRHLPGRIAALEWYLHSGAATPLIPQAVAYFTQSKIDASVTKGKSPPRHPFFTMCDTLLDAAEQLRTAFDRRLSAIKVHFIEYLHTQLRRRKDLRHVHTFDDLLTRLYEALTGRSGAGLVRALSRRYRAALIDEFQDTDPVQYAIFHRIFSAGGTPLLFIGDPKQAIYSFRGADIFTYITAAGDVDHRHTLSVNYRSTPGLTQAVNTLFSGHANPFIYADAIPFRTVASPPERPAHEGSLAIPGLAPMRIMYLGEAFGGKDGWIDNKTAMPLICRITAEEIVRLVESEARIDQRPLRPADIAVLVQTRHEGRAIKKALSKVGLPSVLRGAGSVFESRQAIDLVTVLQAIAGGYNEALVRAALCTPLFGWNGEQLIQSGEQGALEQQYEQFQYYRELWERRGFMAMFRALAEHHDLRATVLGRQDGERCLTNLLHLAELLHHREIESPARGISALIRWFLDAIDSAQAKSQEHELRLESDDDAVRIITIHKSKGLEYPVVFCPFLWRNAEIRDQALTFHDPADGYRTVYDLGSVTQQDTAMCHATRETLAENMRLLYVALTRAKSHCTLFWGRFRAATTSAPAWLFHGNMLPEGGDAVASLRDAMKNLDDHTAIADLRRFAHRSSGTVAVEPLMPPESDGTATFLPKSEHALACRRFTGHIPDDWHLTSFTSLLRGRHENPERPEQDFAPPLLSARQTGDDTEAEDSLFAFPRGPRAGTLLHSILEQADLSACSMDDHRELVEQQLGAYGFDTRWTEVLCQMLLRTGGCSLPDRGRTFRLADIPGEKWLNELEFYFPLQRIDPVQLRALIGHPGPGHEPLAEQIGSLTFSPVRGFMHGFIDCLFENDGRYYIIDWKSNWLGNRYSDYGQEQLQATMLDNLYHLQYLIYSVAVHRHLRWRLTAYDYEKHFGGVYYLFLRGIGPAPDASMGIFADRPPAALIERLNRELIGPHS